MKKYLIGLTAILAVCSAIWAIEIGKYTTMEYMVVEANSGVKDSFPTSDVDSFYFSDSNTVLKIDKSNKTSKTYDVSAFSNRFPGVANIQVSSTLLSSSPGIN